MAWTEKTLDSLLHKSQNFMITFYYTLAQQNWGIYNILIGWFIIVRVQTFQFNLHVRDNY